MPCNDAQHIGSVHNLDLGVPIHFWQEVIEHRNFTLRVERAQVTSYAVDARIYDGRYASVTENYHSALPFHFDEYGFAAKWHHVEDCDVLSEGYCYCDGGGRPLEWGMMQPVELRAILADDLVKFVQRVKSTDRYMRKHGTGIGWHESRHIQARSELWESEA